MRGGILRETKRLFGEDIVENELLAGHCSFRIGGHAAFFLRARELSAVGKALVFCSENSLPFLVLGRGTDVLIPDSGFRGMVIAMRAGAVGFAGEKLVAEAGASLPKVAEMAAERGLGGLEFCAGIPGSVGGAAILNAGAHGESFGNLIEEVSGFPAAESAGSPLLGQEVRFGKEKLRFGYRQSNLQELAGVVATVTLVLRQDAPRAVKERMRQLLANRWETQPVRERCAGSVFKNPPGDFAGRLIELAGCKGMERGGAVVSRKHANFIVNRGKASYSDIKSLIEAVREKVKKVHGVELELEIIDLGEKS